MAFLSLGNSDHVLVSVFINFQTNSKRDAPFQGLAYDYSHTDWDHLWDHLRDVPWEDIFKLSAFAAASEILWVGSGWNWCIYPSLYASGQTSLIFLVFSCLCCCHSSQKSLFYLYQQNISSESKVKFRQASNSCRKVLESYANKTKESIISQKLGSQDFWQITNKGKS